MILSVLLFFACTCISSTASISWLGMGIRKPAKESWSSSNCSEGSAYGFTDGQVEVCQRKPEVLPLLATSAYAVLEECHEVFSGSRWNCDALKTAPNVPRHLKTGTREQAAVYALSSAALGLVVSRACGTGSSENCTCPRDSDHPSYKTLRMSGTQWDGCRFNLDEGRRFTKSFIYPGITENEWGGRKSRYLKFLNKHNTNIGLQVLEKSQKTMCRCIGPTGSCEMKICWKQLPSSLVPLAAAIKKKYDMAMQINKKQIFGVNETSQANNTLRRRFRGELLYSRSIATTYCNDNFSGGFKKGTRGRQCDPSLSTGYGCDVMCCGRGYVAATQRLYSNIYCSGNSSTDCFRDLTAHYCR